jgi:membrane protein
MLLLVLMILITTSVLFKFGTKHERSAHLFLYPVFTTILAIVISFLGIWVLRFSKYNELFTPIGTLLIVMFYIWINHGLINRI